MCKWLVGNAILGRKEEALSTYISTISGLFWDLSMVIIVFNIVHNTLTSNSKIQLSTLMIILLNEVICFHPETGVVVLSVLFF
jgi:hypothetical protein